MRYQLYDIVMARQELGAKVYALVAVEPHRADRPYVGVRLDKGPFRRRFRLGDGDILAKIGTLDPEAIKLDPTAAPVTPTGTWELGRHFAEYMAQRAPAAADRLRWAYLAGLKPGDAVAIRRGSAHGHRIETHRFVEVLPTGQKYHFAAVNPNGTVYKWTLEALHLGAGGGLQSGGTTGEGPPLEGG
jgi:hypothetical protein